MLPWLRKPVSLLDSDTLARLQTDSDFIQKHAYDSNLRAVWLDKIRTLMKDFNFIYKDLIDFYDRLLVHDFQVSTPMSELAFFAAYFQQFCSKKLANHIPEVPKVARQRKIAVQRSESANSVWYVLIHGRFGYVLGKEVETYSDRYVVDIYKDGNLIKSGWSIARENNRIIAVLDEGPSADKQTVVLQQAVEAWYARLREEGRRLKQELGKKVFLANNYYYGTQPCVVMSEDADNYHFAVYKDGNCINPDWELCKSNKRQIIEEIT